MTTLCLDVALENACSRDLHDWIGGSWALLFSNPEDFDPQASEKTQWLEDLRQQFDTRAVRALAVKRDGQPESSWIEELQLDRQLIRLREPPFAAADAVSFAARALRGELLTLKSRFVLLVDGALRRRGLLRYDAGRSAVSALDLLATLDALRYQRPLSRAA